MTLPPLWLACLFDLYRMGLSQKMTPEEAENYAKEHVEETFRERLAETEEVDAHVRYPRERNDE